MKRPLAVVATSLLLAGCITLPSFMRGGGEMTDESTMEMGGLAPVDRELVGKWRVIAQFPVDGDRGAMDHVGKMVKVQERMATDLPGRRCSSATLGMSERILPDGGRFGMAAQGLLAPEGRLPMLVLRCGSRPFGEYLVRADGTLLGRHGDDYLLLTRVGGASAEAMSMADEPAPMASKPQPPVALHLSSEISLEAAKMEWRNLKREYSMLKALKPKYQALDVPGKGHFVRVYAVGEGGKAKWICKELKKKGRYCGVMAVPK